MINCKAKVLALNVTACFSLHLSTWDITSQVQQIEDEIVHLIVIA